MDFQKRLVVIRSPLILILKSMTSTRVLGSVKVKLRLLLLIAFLKSPRFLALMTASLSCFHIARLPSMNLTQKKQLLETTGRIPVYLCRSTYRLAIRGAGDMPIAILFNRYAKMSPNAILLLFITNLIAATKTFEEY